MAGQDLFDVVVIGGGPAGCMAAIGAATADPGLAVAIVDPNVTPQHRIGEALLTGTIMALADAGIADEIMSAGFHRKDGAAYLWGETRDPWYVNYPARPDEAYPDQLRSASGRHALHVPRHKYDAVLRNCAVQRGVSLIHRKAVDVHCSQTPVGSLVVGVELDDGRILRSRQFVDATGQSSLMARRLTRRMRIGSPRSARYGYTRSVDWDVARRAGFDPHRTNIASGENGWLWVIHLGDAGDGLTSVGFVAPPEIVSRLTPENVVEAFPELKMFGFKDCYPEPMTYDGEPLTRFYGHPDYSYACEELDGLNWALAGDAAMFVDPILSQGVTLATHYGLLRGRAAAAQAVGAIDRQRVVSEHYRREGAIMREVVAEWYGNNRSVANWHLQSAVIGRREHGIELDPTDAFRWITNLENIRGEYDPYPEEERRNIARRLGLKEGLRP